MPQKTKVYLKTGIVFVIFMVIFLATAPAIAPIFIFLASCFSGTISYLGYRWFSGI